MAGRPKKGEMTPQQEKILMTAYRFIEETGMPCSTDILIEATGNKDISSKLYSLEMRGFVDYGARGYGKDQRGLEVYMVKLPDGRRVDAEFIVHDDEFGVHRFESDLDALKHAARSRKCITCRSEFLSRGRFLYMCGTCRARATDDLPPEDSGSYISQPFALVSRRTAGFARPDKALIKRKA